MVCAMNKVHPWVAMDVLQEDLQARRKVCSVKCHHCNHALLDFDKKPHRQWE